LEQEKRTCTVCKNSLTLDNYYKKSDGKVTGKICKGCRRERVRVYNKREDRVLLRRERSKNKTPEQREQLVQKSRDYYATKIGRVKSFLKTAKRRSSKFSEECNLDQEYLMNLLGDRCEVTGLEFDYSPHPTNKCNPLAPSIDRIDNSIGYVKGNVRFVIWQYNIMRNELTDDELLFYCERILNAKGLL